MGGTGGKSSKSPIAPAPSQNQTNATDCDKNSGNPVLLTTGEKLLAEADFTVAGIYGFNFVRTYRSRQSGSVLFGSKWTSEADAMKLT
jgi:hypothetical protein